MLHDRLLHYPLSGHLIMDKPFQESGSIPTLPLPINSDAAVGNYLGWQGEQGGTLSPVICTVEALIPLLCEGAGAPGRSSSLPAAWRQSSLLAFEVGVDLKGLSSGFLEAWQLQQQLQTSGHLRVSTTTFPIEALIESKISDICSFIAVEFPSKIRF